MQYIDLLLEKKQIVTKKYTKFNVGFEKYLIQTKEELGINSKLSYLEKHNKHCIVLV